MGKTSIQTQWVQLKSFLSRSLNRQSPSERQGIQTESTLIDGKSSELWSPSFWLNRKYALYSSNTISKITLWSGREANCTVDVSTEWIEACDQRPFPQEQKWIKGVYFCAMGGAVVLLLNLALISVMAILANKHADHVISFHSAVVYNGECGLVKHWNITLHLIINILSTCILAASNYCMQTLVAPTREEIDANHAQYKWLDIGGASVRNLFAIKKSRLALWAVLLITGTPFHLMYNSFVFESSSINEIYTVIGPKDLDSSNVRELTTPALEKCFVYPRSQWPNSEPLSWHEFTTLIENEDYEYLNNTRQCADIMRGTKPGFKAVVALTDNLTVSDGGDASIFSSNLSNMEEEGYSSTAWMKIDHLAAEWYSDRTPGIDSFSFCQEAGHGDSDSSLGHYPINACLAVKAKEHCQLLYSPPIGITIVLAAGVKVAVMLLAARINHSSSPPLLTVGDAIASFMTKPDPTTKGICWMSATDIRQGKWKSLSLARGVGRYPQSIQYPANTHNRLTKCKFWAQAASRWRWIVTLLMCLAGLVGGIFFYTEAITLKNPFRFPHFWLSTRKIEAILSFDVNTSGYVFSSRLANRFSALSLVLIANTPQVLLSISYYYYSSMLTSMLAAAEYSSYGVRRKALRVTWPVKHSQQRSTYWLSMPYQYSVPILAMYTILHWLVSQSLVYYRSTSYDWRDKMDEDQTISCLGYASMPIFLSLLVGGLMVVILGILATRRLPSAIPLAGTCSAAISAACHPTLAEESNHPALGLLKWGETIDTPASDTDSCHRNGHYEGQKGHCSFTSLRAVNPTLTKEYA